MLIAPRRAGGGHWEERSGREPAVAQLDSASRDRRTAADGTVRRSFRPRVLKRRFAASDPDHGRGLPGALLAAVPKRPDHYGGILMDNPTGQDDTPVRQPAATDLESVAVSADAEAPSATDSTPA